MIKRAKNDFLDGLISGLPIGLGYFPVSFTFGIMAVEGGLSPILSILMSLPNLTSAGQFAGTKLIFSVSSLIAIAFATVIINLRYMLMSVSLSQKLATNVGFFKRLVFGFGITDEVFAIAVIRREPLTFKFMTGIMLLPIVGWTFGTAAGAYLSDLLPTSLQAAMGIGLYAMFIAIIIPPSKKHKPILAAVLISVAFSCALYFIPLFDFISSSLKPLICAVIAALIMAIAVPYERQE